MKSHTVKIYILYYRASENFQCFHTTSAVVFSTDLTWMISNDLKRMFMPFLLTAYISSDRLPLWCSLSNVCCLWAMTYITTVALQGWLLTNVSWQAIDSVWSLLFPLLNCGDMIRAGVQMQGWEMVAVHWSWIVPRRGGSVVFLSDGKIRGDG